MFKHFIKLEWKAFARSASFGTNLALKIIMGLGALYFIVCFAILGTAVFFILKDQGMEPLATVSKYLIYWLFYFGYTIEPTIITFNYFIPIPLKWILVAIYRIEIVLWSITPFLENSLISFFGIKTNLVLIVLTEILILSVLLLVLYQCLFKKKL